MGDQYDSWTDLGGRKKSEDDKKKKAAAGGGADANNPINSFPELRA